MYIMYISIYAYVYIYIYVCMYVCMYIYAYVCGKGGWIGGCTAFYRGLVDGLRSPQPGTYPPELTLNFKPQNRLRVSGFGFTVSGFPKTPSPKPKSIVLRGFGTFRAKRAASGC